MWNKFDKNNSATWPKKEGNYFVAYHFWANVMTVNILYWNSIDGYWMKTRRNNLRIPPDKYTLVEVDLYKPVYFRPEEIYWMPIDLPEVPKCLRTKADPHPTPHQVLGSNPSTSLGAGIIFYNLSQYDDKFP